MALLINHVNYIYNEGTALETKAVNDVSFSISDGEFIGVIGHTGCGKSTLMQILNGIIKPSSGGVYYNGQSIDDSDFDLKVLRSKVGLVFQYPEHQLFEEDVFTDVCFGPNNLGLDKSEVELRAYEALKAVNMPDSCFYSSPFELSGGEKRKAAIAGVLAMKPEILILDEPTAGLDPAGRHEILELIKELRIKSNMSIVLVSHSMEDVAEYADRIIVIENGSILFDDTPQKVFTQYEKLESIGLSVPSPERILYKLLDKGIPVRNMSITVDGAVNEIMRIYKEKYEGHNV